MGYKKVETMNCNCCGVGSQAINGCLSKQQQLDILIDCGWKLNIESNIFICNKCLKKGKNEKDCIVND